MVREYGWEKRRWAGKEGAKRTFYFFILIF
jgi:hypothetical protein